MRRGSGFRTGDGEFALGYGGDFHSVRTGIAEKGSGGALDLGPACAVFTVSVSFVKHFAPTQGREYLLPPFEIREGWGARQPPSPSPEGIQPHAFDDSLTADSQNRD